MEIEPLPMDVIKAILQCLDPHTLMKSQQVCKLWSSTVSSTSFVATYIAHLGVDRAEAIYHKAITGFGHTRGHGSFKTILPHLANNNWPTALSATAINKLILLTIGNRDTETLNHLLPFSSPMIYTPGYEPPSLYKANTPRLTWNNIKDDLHRLWKHEAWNLCSRIKIFGTDQGAAEEVFEQGRTSYNSREILLYPVRFRHSENMRVPTWPAATIWIGAPSGSDGIEVRQIKFKWDGNAVNMQEQGMVSGMGIIWRKNSDIWHTQNYINPCIEITMQ